MAWLAGISILIVIVGFIALIVAGPSEFGIVRDRVQGVLQRAVGDDYAVSIAHVSVDVDPVLGLVVRLDDVEVRDSFDSVVAYAPATRLAIDPAALLHFQVRVTDVEIIRAEISLALGANARAFLGNANTLEPGRADQVAAMAADDQRLTEQDVGNEGGFPELMTALQALDHGMELSVRAAVSERFRRFDFIDGVVEMWDADRNRHRRFANTDLNVIVDAATSSVSANLAASGYSGRWTATLDREIDIASGRHGLSVVFSQLTVADLLPSFAEGQGPMAVDIPLYGRANVDFGEDGRLENAEARLDLGAGFIRGGPRADAVLLDEATVKLRWDLANRTIVLEPSTFYFGDTRGVVTGQIEPIGAAGEGRYRYDFESPGAILAPRDTGQPPVVAQRMAVSGTVDLGQRLLTIENAVIRTADASVAAAGSLGFEGKTPSLALAATFAPAPISAIKQIWVPLIAPEARHWVNEHISEGRIVSARFEAAIPGGLLFTGKPPHLADDQIRLDVEVADVAFTTFGDLPPISSASGHIVLAGSTFGVDLESGEIKVPSGDIVNVDAGAYAVPNTSLQPANGVIELELSGSARALGEIADSEPLLALQHRNIDPTTLSGAGTATISLRMPLREGLTANDLTWRVTVAATDLASTAPVEGRSLSEGNLEITITPVDISIYGQARIDGVVADVSMSFPMDETAPVKPGERQVRLVLDDQARKLLGVGLDEILAGTVTAQFSNLDERPDAQHYEFDLRQARLMIPGLGWSKGIGVPAQLSLDIESTEDGYALTNVVLEGDGFGISGSAKLDKAYGLLSANIEHLSLREGDSVSIRIASNRVGYGISARGTSFDLRSLITHVRERNRESGNFPDIAVDLQVDRLVGFGGDAISNAALTMVSIGGSIQKMSFTGSLSGSEVALNYSVAPDGTTLRGTAANAGDLLRYLDLYGRISGGVMNISGQGAPGAPVIGNVDLSNFDVSNEPAMERVIVNDANQPGSGGFDTRRVHFDRMVAQFRVNDRILAIDDALLRGASIGAIFSGRYNLDTTEVSITGTYLPAYSFNNLFSRVPILGLALGGGFREGLIGVTFKIQGPIGSPQIYVNPLSAVAPGIFRKIFEFQ